MRLSTLICWRRTKISASGRALDWNSPISAPQSNLSSWTIGQQHHPIRTGSPAVWSFRNGQVMEAGRRIVEGGVRGRIVVKIAG
jgi:hypothetical protein